MPSQNNSIAPKWDESWPHKLAEYFRELEYLFNDYGIIDNTQQKEYSGPNISYNTVETWLGLPEFAGHSYQEWKLTVMQLYPSTDKAAYYTLSSLACSLKPEPP